MKHRRRPLLPLCGALLAVVLAAALLGTPVARAATACSAADFPCGAAGECLIQGAWDVPSGCVLDFAGRDVRLAGTLRTAVVGGDFRLAAAGLVLDGGRIELPGSQLDFAGSVVVELTGPFVMQGNAPAIVADGNGGGGEITIAANGATLATGRISADGGTGEDCGDGGLILLDAGSGTLRVENRLRARTAGHDCEGGEIDLRGAAIEVSGSVDASGGAQASDFAIWMGAIPGDLTITSTARLRADGTGQYEGYGGIGGGMFLYAQGNVDVAASISARARGWQGIGGDVQIDGEGSVDVSADVRLTTRGGSGGPFSINAGGPARVTGRIDTSGSRRQFAHGGSIQIRSAASLTIAGSLDASGRSAADVYLTGNPLLVTGTVSSRGVVQSGFFQADGCSAAIGGTIDLRTLRGTGDGQLTIAAARQSIASTARLLADEGPCPYTLSGSCVELTSRSGELSLSPSAVIDPTPGIVVDDMLPECPPS
ncbi:hypothetical protein K2Z84_15465 [Candidatus Binatia bacterium]|nr:hypothetical protein [Candidatus Binatia bacterium]